MRRVAWAACGAHHPLGAYAFWYAQHTLRAACPPDPGQIPSFVHYA
jgi:hypothetical protein